MRFMPKLASQTKNDSRSRTGNNQNRRRRTGSCNPQTPTIQAMTNRNPKYPARYAAPTPADGATQAAAIVQDAEAYQRLLDIAARAVAEEGIRQGLEDAKKGKTRPAKELFDEFEAEHGISR